MSLRRTKVTQKMASRCDEQVSKQTESQKVRQPHRQTDTQTGREAERHTCGHIPTHAHTKTHAHTHTRSINAATDMHTCSSVIPYISYVVLTCAKDWLLTFCWQYSNRAASLR